LRAYEDCVRVTAYATLGRNLSQLGISVEFWPSEEAAQRIADLVSDLADTENRLLTP
jgi:hypothetical protein